MNAPLGSQVYCRFRDCPKAAEPNQLFCRFHLSAECSPTAASHALGSMRAVARTLRQQPADSDTARYGLALATTLTKWFGDEAKQVVAECARVLGSMR